MLLYLLLRSLLLLELLLLTLPYLLYLLNLIEK